MHRIEPVVSDCGPARRLGIVEPVLHLPEPVPVIGRGEEALVPSQ